MPSPTRAPVGRRKNAPRKEPKKKLRAKHSSRKAAPKDRSGRARPSNASKHKARASSASKHKGRPRAGRSGSRQERAPQTEQRGGNVQQGERGGGNASVTLTTEQRTRIRDTVLKEKDAPRVGRVDFSVREGTVIPRTVHVVEVPRVIIDIHPEWRGYKYFIVNDEIVIVEPSTLRIVAVIPA